MSRRTSRQHSSAHGKTPDRPAPRARRRPPHRGGGKRGGAAPRALPARERQPAAGSPRCPPARRPLLSAGSAEHSPHAAAAVLAPRVGSAAPRSPRPAEARTAAAPVLSRSQYARRREHHHYSQAHWSQQHDRQLPPTASTAPNKHLYKQLPPNFPSTTAAQEAHSETPLPRRLPATPARVPMPRAVTFGGGAAAPPFQQRGEWSPAATPSPWDLEAAAALPHGSCSRSEALTFPPRRESPHRRRALVLSRKGQPRRGWGGEKSFPIPVPLSVGACAASCPDAEWCGKAGSCRARGEGARPPPAPTGQVPAGRALLLGSSGLSGGSESGSPRCSFRLPALVWQRHVAGLLRAKFLRWRARRSPHLARAAVSCALAAAALCVCGWGFNSPPPLLLLSLSFSSSSPPPPSPL